MDGWNTSFLLGWPVFRGCVSFRECSSVGTFALTFFNNNRHFKPAAPQKTLVAPKYIGGFGTRMWVTIPLVSFVPSMSRYPCCPTSKKSSKAKMRQNPGNHGFPENISTKIYQLMVNWWFGILGVPLSNNQPIAWFKKIIIINGFMTPPLSQG